MKLSFEYLSGWLDALGNPTVLYIHPSDFIALDTFLQANSRTGVNSPARTRYVRFEETTIYPNNHMIVIGGQYGWE
jgi:hypothetical protein